MRFHLSLCLAFGLGAPAVAGTPYFGFAGVACGLDDPHDGATITDYSAEIAGFTNLNQVCPQVDIATSAKVLARAARLYTPLYAVEPFLFARTGGRLAPLATPQLDLLAAILSEAQVNPADMVFYLVDEPSLRGLRPDEIEAAAARLSARWPDTPILLIEAFQPGPPPPIPASITYWGFDLYAIADPAKDARFMAYLDQAAGALAPQQRLVLVLDAQHTPSHARAGLSPNGMATVARNWAALAAGRSDVAALLGYAWPGGIDGAHERGARDLPAAVQEVYRQIGREIIGAP